MDRGHDLTRVRRPCRGLRRRQEVAAQVRLRAGRRLDSPAPVADGFHARTDGFVSLGVMLSALLVALGLPIADPVIAIIITGVILQITVQSWRTVRGRGHSHAT